MIKFSVLIPTRNRVQYLKFAIESVLMQDYDQWEIIISDNFSEEDVEGYVRSLNEPRIKYYRTSSFIPVTDNWNLALEKSEGDYVIMLGDDDGLMPRYFSTILTLLNRYENPDFIYNSALLYAYPEVFPEFPNGLLHKWGNAEFFENVKEPFVLGKDDAIKMIKKSFDFKVLFNFNMQFALVARSLIQELQREGNFYQSPYPDYYAMTTLFLKAKKILAVPYPLVIVGITPKSFGYYYFNQKEQEGNEFLKNYPNADVLKTIEKYVMPGSSMNTSWLCALETVKQNYGKKYDLKLNYKNYRFLQILYYFKNFASEKTNKEVGKMARHLYLRERLLYLLPFLLLGQFFRMKKDKKERDIYINKVVTSFSHPSFTMKRIEKDFNNLSEIINDQNLFDSQGK